MASLVKTTEYLVHLIDCSVNGLQPDEKPNDISFDNVFRVALAHCVGGLSYLSVVKLKTKPDEDLLTKWENNYLSTVKRSIKQQSERDKIIKKFNEQKIKSIELKGTVTKNLYPQPDLRFMTDLDFIVKTEDLPKIKEICVELGYASEKEMPYELNFSYNGKFSIEFHTDFFSPDSKYSKVLCKPFDYVGREEESCCYVDSTTFYLYNLLHFAKHLEIGCGIRKVLDLYFLDKRYSDCVDKGNIKEKLGVYNDFESVNKYIRLSKHWFSEEKSHENFEDEIKYTAFSGVNGSKKVMLKKQINTNAKKGKSFAKIRMGFKMVFQPKEVIYAEYPVCCERKYPTVVCWAYRLGSTVKNKEKRKRISSWVNGIKNTKIEK